MGSAQASQKLFANLCVEVWDHDPDTTNALAVSPDAGTTKRYAAMRDFFNFAVVAMSSKLTGAGIALLEIVAAEDAAGTNATQIKTSGVVVCDTVGDTAALECTAEEIVQIGRALGYAFTHVAGRITMANAADEAAVTYIRAGARFPHADLTAATTIAA